jgi:hypothetical protein
MESISLKIARDYSPNPGPRYIKEGENSGELFRQTKLLPAFKQAVSDNKKLIVDLDGTAGYGTSFLEESFGGLIREENISYETIVRTLEIISDEEEFLKDDINHYLKDAHEAKAKTK